MNREDSGGPGCSLGLLIGGSIGLMLAIVLLIVSFAACYVCAPGFSKGFDESDGVQGIKRAWRNESEKEGQGIGSP